MFAYILHIWWFSKYWSLYKVQKSVKILITDGILQTLFTENSTSFNKKVVNFAMERNTLNSMNFRIVTNVFMYYSKR